MTMICMESLFAAYDKMESYDKDLYDQVTKCMFNIGKFNNG